MRFVIRSRNEFINIAAQVGDKFDGKPYTVTIKRFVRPRTLDQNKKLHAMLGELADHCGYSDAEMKDWAKAELELTKVIQIGSNVCEVPLPTSEYTVQQLSDLIDRIQQIGAEIGCAFRVAK